MNIPIISQSHLAYVTVVMDKTNGQYHCGKDIFGKKIPETIVVNGFAYDKESARAVDGYYIVRYMCNGEKVEEELTRKVKSQPDYPTLLSRLVHHTESMTKNYVRVLNYSAAPGHDFNRASEVVGVRKMIEEVKKAL